VREKGDTDSDVDFTKQSYDLCKNKSFSEKKERKTRTSLRGLEIFDRQHARIFAKTDLLTYRYDFAEYHVVYY